MAAKPIRVFYAPLSGTFYATQHWREEKHGDKVLIACTGKKYEYLETEHVQR